MDSLLAIWNNASQNDSIRLEAYREFIWTNYLFSEPDSANYFAQIQYDFAEKNGNERFMAIALNTRGVSSFIRGDYAKSLDLYNRALDIYEKSEDRKGIAATLNNFAIVYKTQGFNSKAIEIFTRILKIKEEIGNKEGIANCLNNIGIFSEIVGDYPKSLEYHLKALALMEDINDLDGLSMSLNNIGDIYISLDSLDKALEYTTRSLKIRRELGLKKQIASSLTNFGTIYYLKGDYNRAIDYHLESLNIREEVVHKSGISNSLTNLGEIYRNLGDINKALNYLERALVISDSIGEIKKSKEAAGILWELYRETGRYREGLDMYELFIGYRDSLLNEGARIKIIDQEYKYNYDKKRITDSLSFIQEKEMDQLLHKSNLEAETNKKYSLYASIVFLIILGGVILRAYNRKKKDHVSIKTEKQRVESAHNVLNEKNLAITQSIKYAKRIQNAILPSESSVKELLPDSFILYKPKDIVAGDFYWVENVGDLVLFASADCTGHGVPGAMVSFVCVSSLNRSVREFDITDPGKILDKTRELVLQEFEKSDKKVNDGMDISLCAINFRTNELQWAGAYNPLWIVRKEANAIEEVKADKQPIGHYERITPFTTHKINLNKGDTIYTATDGFHDQFGGEFGKKYMSSHLKHTLFQLSKKPIEEQYLILEEEFFNWKGGLEQLDDVCVFGVRI